MAAMFSGLWGDGGNATTTESTSWRPSSSRAEGRRERGREGRREGGRTNIQLSNDFHRENHVANSI